MFLFGIIALIAIRWVVKDYRESKMESQAIHLDCDMSSKFKELLDDETMTDDKWRDWLPVFEFADAEIRRKAPRLSLGNQAYLIRTRILDEDLTGQ